MLYDDFRAMNSDILMAVEGDPASSTSPFASARSFIQRSEQRFTRFSDDSELSALNRSAGAWFHASEDFFEVICQAYRLAGETRGLFNPAVLPALKLAGYDQSMDQIRRRNSTALSGEFILPSVDVPDFWQIQLNPEEHLIRLPAGMQIDLGGIAKGWIAERAARLLSENSTTCAVSAGGDMVLIGLPSGQPAWQIGLEDPFEPDRDLEILSVAPGAVATSSVTKRHWMKNGQPQHHLIDPRTGLPAETEWVSVTVWAEHAAEAEVYAKALLIGGIEAANQFFSHSSTKAFLAVDRFDQLSGSRNHQEVFNVNCQIAL